MSYMQSGSVKELLAQSFDGVAGWNTPTRTDYGGYGFSLSIREWLSSESGNWDIHYRAEGSIWGHTFSSGILVFGTSKLDVLQKCVAALNAERAAYDEVYS